MGNKVNTLKGSNMTTTETKDPAGRITQAELARRLQVSRSAVTKAVQSGRITAGEDGRFDPEEAERQWRANTRPNMKAASASPAAKSKATGYAESRAKKERHAANILEMREAEIRGRMMKTELVLDIVSNLNFGWRGFLDNLPIHLAKAVYGINDLDKLEIAIEQEINRRMDGMPVFMERLAYQGKALELPPSPVEREILENMWADTRKRLNVIYGQAFREVVELVKQRIGVDLPEWDFVKDEVA